MVAAHTQDSNSRLRVRSNQLTLGCFTFKLFLLIAKAILDDYLIKLLHLASTNYE
jgi:hypothetical protein